MSHAIAAIALAAVGLMLCAPASAQMAADAPPGIKQPGQFPVVPLTIGLYQIKAEVAANDADREQGLMYRTRLDDNNGMLFVFDDDAGHCFWMKNTVLPLSVAFITADGTIANTDEMEAETTNNHCPTRPVRYVLEMRKGWFKEKGIDAGMQVQGLQKLMSH